MIAKYEIVAKEYFFICNAHHYALMQTSLHFLCSQYGTLLMELVQKSLFLNISFFLCTGQNRKIFEFVHRTEKHLHCVILFNGTMMSNWNEPD